MTTVLEPSSRMDASPAAGTTPHTATCPSRRSASASARRLFPVAVRPDHERALHLAGRGNHVPGGAQHGRAARLRRRRCGRLDVSDRPWLGRRPVRALRRRALGARRACLPRRSNGGRRTPAALLGGRAALLLRHGRRGALGAHLPAGVSLRLQARLRESHRAARQPGVRRGHAGLGVLEVRLERARDGAVPGAGRVGCVRDGASVELALGTASAGWRLDWRSGRR